jgi:hypothetical protein
MAYACRPHLVRGGDCTVVEMSCANGHGVSATPENVNRCRHDRFPYPDPEGEGDSERAARDFNGNELAV